MSCEGPEGAVAKETAHVQGFKFGQGPQFRRYGTSEGVGGKLQCHQVCQRAKGRRECAAKLIVLRIAALHCSCEAVVLQRDAPSPCTYKDVRVVASEP